MTAKPARRSRRWAGLAAAAALSSLVAGCAEGTMAGGDSRDISEAESGLIFYGPGVEGGFRRFLRESNSAGAEFTVGIFGPASGRLPRAEIVFYRPPPLYFLSRPATPGDLLDDFEFFSGRRIYFGKSGQSTNRIGTAQYQILAADDMSCVVFDQPFGSRQYGMAGNKALFGFYCRDSSAPLDPATVERVIAAVGHADYGAPTPPPGEEVGRASGPAATAMPVRVDWAGRGDGIAGTIAVVEAVLNGEFRLRLDDGTSCAGMWTHLSGVYGTDSAPSGQWEMICDNGLSAAGSYVSREPGAGDFAGTDQQGRAVRLRYGAS